MPFKGVDLRAVLDFACSRQESTGDLVTESTPLAVLDKELAILFRT